jgi:mannosyltransferase
LLGWHALGDGEAFLRLPSVAFAVATVPVVYALGRRLADPWVGAIAAAVLAGHALVLQWGQQLRSYTLSAFLVTLASLLLVRAVERPSTGRCVACAAVAVAAAYAHLFAALVIGAHVVSLALLRPLPWRVARIAGVTGALLAAPLAWHVLTRTGDPLGWIGEPSTRQLTDALADLAGGGIRHLVVLGCLAAVGAVVSVRRASQDLHGPDGWRAVLPVLWLVLPLAVVVGATYTVKPLLVARFLIVVVPALALLVAVGIRSLPVPMAAVGAVAVAVVSLQAAQAWYNVEGHEDWRGATASVVAGARPGDAVLVLPGRAVHAVRYYGPDLRTVPLVDARQQVGARVWVVERLSQIGTRRPVPLWFEEWIDGGYRVVADESFANVHVRLYEHR